MIARSLRGRLATALVGCLVAALVAIAAATLASTRVAASRHAEAQLDVGARVFGRLLEVRAQQLTSAAQVLAADFGFKEAVATRDADTVGLALLNHGTRIGAAFAVLVDDNGTTLADSGHVHAPSDFGQLLEAARAAGSGDSFAVVDGMPMQLVMVPVHAPIRIAWVVLGFAMDARLADELRALSGLHVAFVGGAHTISTLRIAPATAEADRFLLRSVALDSASGTLEARLFADRTEAFAPFSGLQRTFGLIVLGALAVSLAISLLLARSLARPLDALAAAARRIGAGDYDAPIDSRRDDELGVLARALTAMKAEIAIRQRHIEHQAYHDALTGLPNRASAIAMLEARLRSTGPRRDSVAVLLLDGNHFKEINDTLGHDVGDKVLVALGRRLRDGTHGRDLVARLGGDEFLLVLEGADEDAALAAAGRISLGAAEPFSVDGMALHLDVSIGVAVYPQHGDDPQTLLRRADIAMYEAKQSSERVRLYSAGEDTVHLRRLLVIGELRRALADGALELHYQPKLDLGDGSVRQVEALLRWHHPEHGAISPEEFIPLAEHSGLIHPLTRFVLEKALRQAALWRRDGLDVAVAVNVSAMNLMDGSLPAVLRSMLSAHALPPASLIVEITESAVMRDAGRAVRVLERLREFGLRLSIDDFGTGQSSLSQLRNLPVHEIKIDRSFILRMGRTAQDAAIVRSTIELGHSMGLNVVAEGVEDDACRALLEGFGCDLAQGWLIARPMPGDALAAWMRERATRCPTRTP